MLALADNPLSDATAYPLAGKVKRWLWRRGFVDGRKGIRPHDGATRITRVISFFHEEVVAEHERTRDEALAKLTQEERSIPVLRDSVEASLQAAELALEQLLGILPQPPDPSTRSVPGERELKLALLFAKAKRELGSKVAQEKANVAELKNRLDHLNVRADQIPAAKEAQRELTEDLKAKSKAYANRQIAYYGAVMGRWHKDRKSLGSGPDLSYL